MLSMDNKEFDFSSVAAGTEKFLSDLISFRSTSGNELEMMDYIADEFSKLDVVVEKIPLSNTIKLDSDYANTIPILNYDGHYNIRICRSGINASTGRKLLLNTHADVVPPSKEMPNAWSSVKKDRALWGRGACDAKGQIATLYSLLSFIDKQDMRFGGDLVAHIVVEEENGGNGSLAMVNYGELADSCIVLEPTDCKVLTSVRGAVWFKLVFNGEASHSGSSRRNKSILKMGLDAINVLQEYHQVLTKNSQDVELFTPAEKFVTLTFGRLIAGNWPASVPDRVLLEGVLGFVSNKSKEDICSEVRGRIETYFKEITDDYELTFTYAHDCSVIDPKDFSVVKFIEAVRHVGVEADVAAMPASCDAWFYANYLKIPTFVFGPGSMEVAHSRDEHIVMDDIIKAAQALYLHTKNYCGTTH